MNHKTGTLLLPTEHSVKNSLTAVLTVAGIGTTTRKVIELSMNRGGPRYSVYVMETPLLGQRF